MANRNSPIPTFYWVFFIIIDPCIALWGAYLNVFTPEVAVDAFVPASMAPFNPLQAFLGHQLGGALVMCAILDIFLLRKTNEVWIWNVQQAGQLVYDIFIIASMYYSLNQQDRLRLGALRAEDWGSFLITGTCGVVRALFCAGVGLGKVQTSLKRR